MVGAGRTGLGAAGDTPGNDGGSQATAPGHGQSGGYGGASGGGSGSAPFAQVTVGRSSESVPGGAAYGLPASPLQGALAHTGAEILALASAGAGAMLLGILLLAAARRRRREQAQA